MANGELAINYCHKVHKKHYVPQLIVTIKTFTNSPFAIHH